MDKVSPSGRVIGVDVIHSPPPTGVSTIQGNFLDSQVQDMLRDFVANPARGRPREKPAEKDYIALERSEGEPSTIAAASTTATPGHASDESHGRHVHVVLSDMSEPWPPLAGFLRSLTVPYRRLMNVSGAAFRDHAGSMVFSLHLPPRLVPPHPPLRLPVPPPPRLVATTAPMAFD